MDQRIYKSFLIALLLILTAGESMATHYYGLDLFYTHVSGNTYKVTMVAYGDCSGVQFPSFAVVRPRIHIRQGNGADIIDDFLDHEPPQQGVEVTPVCPEELNNTNCKSPTGTVPGVTKFVYSKEFTLSGPAPDWKFIFFGETDGATTAGRSNSLTNVAPPGIICLVATLDNTQQANSSPEYTTIATPFYCVNRPTNFNPGAVDANGDSLVYELVPGLDSNESSLVNYVAGYSAGNPLHVATQAFNFSSKTGQLNFTPDQIQRSLVVYRVYEYRNGVLVGTSMREMTVVIMNCNNNPPLGYISNALGATIVDTVTVITCKGSHEVAFDINPTDADGGHIINMVANGLPKDSKLDITNNNTTNPLGRFTWSMPALPDGDYTFFVTYTDNGCPIASKQTQAYTIRIGPEDIMAEVIAPACIEQGLVKVTVPLGWKPWSYTIYKDAEIIYSLKGIDTNSRIDSIPAGQFKVQAINDLGCMAEKLVDVTIECNIADLPNAFSPNGDNRNDILFVRGLNIKTMDLKIFNRWGQLVFESHDANKGWDGKFNGSEQPIEAYAYILSVGFKSGKAFLKKGNVSLLR